MTQREEELDKELNELKSKLLEYQEILVKKECSFEYGTQDYFEDVVIECREEFERLLNCRNGRN